MKGVKIAIVALIFLVIGLSIGLYGSAMFSKPGTGGKPTAVSPSPKKKILFYRNPMNPSITSPVPKKDEMGMDYVPVYEGGESGGPEGTVTIDPVVEQNIGVRISKARVMRLSKIVRTYGRVVLDEDRIYSVYPRFKGWIERVIVSREGERVKKGQLLCTVYSPELLSTEQEYLVALKGKEILKGSDIGLIRKNSSRLVSAAKRRLELFGITDSEIRRLERTSRPLTALGLTSIVTGTVMKTEARKGLFVTPTTPLYQIADLSTVWVFAEVYEKDIPWIEKGNEAEIRFEALKGAPLRGKVDFVYPYENLEKRTIRVRMIFPNRDGRLRPEMFGDVSIMASPRMTLAVPSQAVIQTGTRQLVFVQTAPGRFEPREIETGISASGYTEILKGLSPGEDVVTSSQFLIDSESRLREATAKMLSPDNGKAAGNMAKMDTGAGTDKGQKAKNKK